MFLDPTGAQVGEQIQGEEGIAYANLDLNDCVAPKQFHDVVGGYQVRPTSIPQDNQLNNASQRFDIFDLKVSRSRMGPENAFLGHHVVHHELGHAAKSAEIMKDTTSRNVQPAEKPKVSQSLDVRLDEAE